MLTPFGENTSVSSVSEEEPGGYLDVRNVDGTEIGKILPKHFLFLKIWKG